MNTLTHAMAESSHRVGTPSHKRLLALGLTATTAVIAAGIALASILSTQTPGAMSIAKVTPGYTDTLPRMVGQHCGDQCAIMMEGYQWAQLNDIRRPTSCQKYTGAFADGCLAYITYRNETRRSPRTGR